MAQENTSEKYSRVFINFANAKSADEAVSVFFYDIQQAFNLSDNFPRKAQKAFPGIVQRKLNLTLREKEYLELIDKKTGITNRINVLMNNSQNDFEYYDDESQEFAFLTYREYDGHSMATSYKIPADGIPAGVRYLDIPIHQQVALINDLNALSEIYSAITSYPLPDGKWQKIAAHRDQQRRKSGRRNYIETTQKSTQLLLITLKESNDFTNTKIFKSVVARYNMLLKSKIIASKKYAVQTITFPFSDGPLEDVLLEKIMDATNTRAEYFNECISYCFIDFLKQPDACGGQRIKKCPYCENFFLAKDMKRVKCYEKRCENEYHKDDMKKRREADPVKYC